MAYIQPSKRIFIISCIALIVVFLVGFFIQESIAAGEIEDGMELGFKFIMEGKYDEAILAFEKVIKIDSKNVRALTALGIAYSAIGDYEKAKAVLNTVIEEDPKSVYAYDELSRIYRIEGKDKEAQGILSEGINITQDESLENAQRRILERTLVGQVIDSSDTNAVANAKVVLYKGENYTNKYAETYTDAVGTYVVKATPGIYKIIVKTDGYKTAEAYQKINTENITYQSEIQLISNKAPETDSITLILYDAFTGKTIGGSNFKINYIPGLYSETPTIDKSVLTKEVNSEGQSEAIMPVGNYTARVTSVDGKFKTAAAHINVGGSIKNTDIYLTPVLKDKEMRAVLTWTSPVDLDTFTIGQDFKVFFKNKKHNGNIQVSLDVDDTDGYGPETVTILSTSDKESFSFYVDNFSENRTNGQDSISSKLTRSRAKVVLYIGPDEKREFNVPFNKKGSTWKVFEVVNGEVQASNLVGTGAMVGYKNDGSIE